MSQQIKQIEQIFECAKNDLRESANICVLILVDTMEDNIHCCTLKGLPRGFSTPNTARTPIKATPCNTRRTCALPAPFRL